MNKKSYVQKKIGEDIWAIFSEVYGIASSDPTSERQELLLRKVSDYVYEKFATQISRDKLKGIFEENKGG